MGVSHVKTSTLKKRSHFLAAAASGVRWVAPGFILQIGKVADLEQGQPAFAVDTLHFGLTASRKIGNAVVRNRARRRLRAIAQEILAAKADLSHYYVLVARKDTTNSLKRSVLVGDVEKALRRFSLLRVQAEGVRQVAQGQNQLQKPT